MRTILALGNPGDRYRDTRHNVGWWLADRLRTRWSLPPFEPDGLVFCTQGTRSGRTVRILKPLTYVNRSGGVAAEVAAESGFDLSTDLLVVMDDVSLSPGEFRFRARGSSGGHRGLESIEQSLRTREYARLRIGVGRPPEAEIDLAAWVLAPMPPAEEETVLAAFDSMVAGVECWAGDGIAAAMDRFNRRSGTAGPDR